MDIFSEVRRAEQRIRDHIRETPLEPSPYLDAVSESQVFLKLECHQITGSFKLRGAANKLLSLSEDKKQRGIVTASSGNHAAASAHLLRKLKIDGQIFLPETASQAKVEALRLMNAPLVFFGDDCVKAEMEARRIASTTGRAFVSPYNDPEIIAGQGSAAAEIVRQVDRVDVVIVPVGGGGLISGVGGFLKAYDSAIRVIGCQPENSRVMYESLKAGKILDIPSEPTLSDGTAGGIEPDSITFSICQQVVDEIVLVTEEEIRSAILLMLERHHLLIEGAAATSVAAFLKTKGQYAGMDVALVLTGAKISLDQLKSIISQEAL